jgi:hypothetical protein
MTLALRRISRLVVSVAGRLRVGKDLLSFSRPLCGEG